MSKKLAYFLILIVVSCTQNHADDSAAQVPVIHKDMSSEVYKTVAVLSIEGMMCEEGCGGKIQSELRALQGVKVTELDFVDQRQSNFIRVEYDPSVLSELKIFDCVHQIADGKYKVTSAEIIHYKGLQSSQHGGALPV